MSQWFPVLHIMNATDHNRDCICMKSRLLYYHYHAPLQIKDHYNNNIIMTLAASLVFSFKALEQDATTFKAQSELL